MAIPLMAGLAIAGGLGKILGTGAKKAEESRMSQAALNLQQDQLRNSQYNTGQQAQMQAGNLDLSRKQFSEAARGNRGREAMIGDILANWSPTQIDVPGVKKASISGGLQNLGPGAREAAKLLNQKALLALLEGDSFSGGEILNAPALTPMPKAGKMENIGGILGTLGSIAGGLAPLFGQEQETSYIPRPNYQSQDWGSGVRF